MTNDDVNATSTQRGQEGVGAQSRLSEWRPGLGSELSPLAPHTPYTVRRIGLEGQIQVLTWGSARDWTFRAQGPHCRPGKLALPQVVV